MEGERRGREREERKSLLPLISCANVCGCVERLNFALLISSCVSYLWNTGCSEPKHRLICSVWMLFSTSQALRHMGQIIYLLNCKSIPEAGHKLTSY